MLVLFGFIIVVGILRLLVILRWMLIREVVIFILFLIGG